MFAEKLREEKLKNKIKEWPVQEQEELKNRSRRPEAVTDGLELGVAGAGGKRARWRRAAVRRDGRGMRVGRHGRAVGVRVVGAGTREKKIRLMTTSWLRGCDRLAHISHSPY